MFPRMQKRMVLLIIGLCALCAVFAQSADAAGQRIMVQISEPFEIDGELFPAGTVTVREVSDYNPRATINEVWVDNRCLGILPGLERPSESQQDVDSLFFKRERGHLVLIGVSFRGGPVRDLHSFRTNHRSVARHDLVAMR